MFLSSSSEDDLVEKKKTEDKNTFIVWLFHLESTSTTVSIINYQSTSSSNIIKSGHGSGQGWLVHVVRVWLINEPLSCIRSWWIKGVIDRRQPCLRAKSGRRRCFVWLRISCMSRGRGLPEIHWRRISCMSRGLPEIHWRGIDFLKCRGRGLPEIHWRRIDFLKLRPHQDEKQDINVE